MNLKSSEASGASFRDPNGFVFLNQGTFYRQINQSYAADHAHLMESGLYDKLVKAGLLVAHAETEFAPPEPANKQQDEGEKEEIGE